MTLAAAIQGAKRPSQTITWTDEDGVAVDLTGATITARIRNVGTGVTATSDGVFAPTVNASDGEFTWAYGSNDILAAGMYEVQFSAAYGSGVTPSRTFLSIWTVSEGI